MTGVGLAMPLGLLGAAALGDPPARDAVVAVVACVAAVYAHVWLVWRPTCFEVDVGVLRIVWPVRTREIPRRLIGDVRAMTAAELRARYGFGVRIGAGGLWGGFGLYWTRTTTFSFWVSRTDRMVVVEVTGARPLLVTPEDPERFVAMLRA